MKLARIAGGAVGALSLSTGAAVALILSSLGVHRDDIFADYLESRHAGPDLMALLKGRRGGIDYSTMEIVYEGYVLRPENIESAYYLYHFTGDARYLEMGKEYFDSLVRFCRNDVGYAHLQSVLTGEQRDAMQSFFLAETMKYCYLIFAPGNTVDFGKTIFNTEAHPLKIWKE